MSKNQTDLEEELNENLDFLEDEEASQINAPTNSVSKHWNFNANHKQIAMFTAAGIIGILIISWIIYPKKHSRIGSNASSLPLKSATSSSLNNSNLKNISNDVANNKPPGMATSSTAEQNLNKNLESSLTLTQPGQLNVDQPNSQQLPTDNNLTWQELKKSINEEIKAPSALPQQLNQLQPLITSTNQKTADNSSSTTAINTNVPIEGFAKPLNNEQSEALTLAVNNKIQESAQELKEVIANITADLVTNVNQIKELQNTLKDLSRSVSSATSTINSIDSKILNLTNNIDSLSIEIKNLKKHLQDEDADLTATIKQSESDLFSNSPEYVVHAVIPGRAWLKSSSGQIISVTEGDLLGDYGKIAFIDPTSNIVRTSSGVVFR